VGEDGSVAILEIRDKDRKAPSVRGIPEVDFAEEILVARSDMEEKQATINEMKNKYDELTLQHEYQTKLRELNHSEKTKELGEKMSHDVDAWRTKYEALSQEKNEAEMEYIENTRQLEAKHQAKIQDLDRKYQQKIVDEVERYPSPTQQTP
jgi:cilia- and flagella-associated protein 57